MALQNLFRKKSIAQIFKQVEQNKDGGEYHTFNKILSVRDLVALGIAAVIGAGIFSTVGKACFDGGPAVILLFVITAVACGFSALCYAEFSSQIPISGSAYTYSYVAFGELVAWIIGWALLMEYAVGNITVAISWSSNLSSFLNNIGVHIPRHLATSFFEAKNGHDEFIASGAEASDYVKSLHNLWLSAPRIGEMPFIFNLPALIITVFITWLIYVGVKESRTSNNLMVAFKLLVILVVIVVGFFYVNPENWIPFAPNGMSGVMKGVSAVFFAYIGFDAISTVAEECKDPQRDLPKGMIYSLIICTVLYILIALVLTGMVSYKQLDVGDFLASAFNSRGMNWLGGIIALSAVVATTTVLLVFQMGQPRIWMSMSRDGLLPKRFAKIHPKYKTPSFSTIVTGCVVGIPALFLDSDLVTDLCSIGTLFAFALVCGGVLLMPAEERQKAKFKIPYVNSKYIVPALLILVPVLIHFNDPAALGNFFSLTDAERTAGEVFKARLPYYIFVLFAVFIGIYSFIKSYSLIPVLGLISCTYLMTELGIKNWISFSIWLVIGLVVYFSYGYKNSKLASPPSPLLWRGV